MKRLLFAFSGLIALAVLLTLACAKIETNSTSPQSPIPSPSTTIPPKAGEKFLGLADMWKGYSIGENVTGAHVTNSRGTCAKVWQTLL